ncbi:MAG: glycosyltransferase [Candidatus Hadarchaeales archaeon]
MRVGLIGSTKGLGSLEWYTRGLYEGLKERGIDVEIIWKEQPKFPGAQTLHTFFLLPAHVLKRAAKFDIVHAIQPSFSVVFPLLRGVRKVVTIHDLIPLFHPQEFTSPAVSKLINFSAFSLWSLSSSLADLVIANSELTKSDVVRLGIPENKVKVINLWVRPTIRRVEVHKSRKTVLGYVGAITYRKDVKYIVKAFNEFQKHERNSELWLCGSCSDRWYVEEVKQLISELGLEKKVKIVEAFPEEEISKIYSSLSVFISGTRFEGFGLPILEAQKCGVPVIIREEAIISHEVRKYCFLASSPKDMAEKALEIIDGRFKEKIELAMEHAASFTLERAVSQLIKLYEEILK